LLQGRKTVAVVEAELYGRSAESPEIDSYVVYKLLLDKFVWICGYHYLGLFSIARAARLW